MSVRAKVPCHPGFRKGLRDGLPIALGYFAVSFSLGITARNLGVTALQGFLASLLNNASAGEYAGFTQIAAQSTYWEMALITLITNARYLLMSCALSQRFSPDTGLGHRLLVGFDVTDEIFGITIAQPGFLDPYYSYGAMTLAIPAWAVGTMLGVMVGNILPTRLVSALSVALYGMFLAIIIPPCRTSKPVVGLVLVSFVLSALTSFLPVFAALSDGIRVILLTIIISAVGALLFPVSMDSQEAEHAQ